MAPPNFGILILAFTKRFCVFRFRVNENCSTRLSLKTTNKVYSQQNNELIKKKTKVDSFASSNNGLKGLILQILTTCGYSIVHETVFSGAI